MSFCCVTTKVWLCEPRMYKPWSSIFIIYKTIKQWKVGVCLASSGKSPARQVGYVCECSWPWRKSRVQLAFPTDICRCLPLFLIHQRRDWHDVGRRLLRFAVATIPACEGEWSLWQTTVMQHCEHIADIHWLQCFVTVIHILHAVFE